MYLDARLSIQYSNHACICINHGSLPGGKLIRTACTIPVGDFFVYFLLSTSCVLVMRALRFTFPISRWGFAGRKSADAALHEKVLPADSQLCLLLRCNRGQGTLCVFK